MTDNKVDYEQAVKLYAEGLTVPQIMAQINRPESTIRGWVKGRRSPTTAKRWTPEKKEQLRELWPQGKIAWIAEQLGMSKSAVGGEAYRMGLPRRTPIREKTPKEKAPKKAKPVVSPPQDMTQPESPKPIMVGVGFMDSTINQCRWPLDDRGADGLMKFCGQQCVLGRSYCDTHAQLVYQRMKI